MVGRLIRVYCKDLLGAVVEGREAGAINEATRVEYGSDIGRSKEDWDCPCQHRVDDLLGDITVDSVILEGNDPTVVAIRCNGAVEVAQPVPRLESDDSFARH